MQREQKRLVRCDRSAKRKLARRAGHRLIEQHGIGEAHVDRDRRHGGCGDYRDGCGLLELLLCSFFLLDADL